ncbi:1-acyl-sn-glycerol-3-phosphate acyltransferase [Marivivens niveibacter]|uniref:1-acyl-sn-glycerol-3-phosphate acyltransferase n=1 Tax=Marivivens niveibacter TaxID=1930667 RepID=UPI0030846398
MSRLNKRLARPIEPFKLARRYDTIQRVIYDPEVTKAIHRTARVEGIPENVASERARRYAREIVPSFSATVYFGIGARLSRWLSRAFYKIRLGALDRDKLAAMDPNATWVFVINHRSNMDYVLITHMISSAGTLAYAVGEWARVWPLSWLVRAMGAYFIRRGSHGQLYRAVLAAYVRLATQNGVSQAFFPEGGLSLTGAMGRPKLGLLSYMVEGWDADDRDVIFVPVALNYDRVPEDRILVRAAQTGERKFRPSFGAAVLAIPVTIWRAIRLKFTPFGTAAVGFGKPLVLSEFMKSSGSHGVEQLAEDLMDRMADTVPLVPTPLVARAVLAGADTAEKIENHIAGTLDIYAARGGALPRRGPKGLTKEGIALLVARKILVRSAAKYSVADGELPLVEYYAASIAHHFDH